MAALTTGQLGSAAAYTAATLLLCSAAAFGQVLLPAARAAPGTQLLRVGPTTGEVEKDSFGLAAPPVPVCLTSRFSDRPQTVGPVTDNPEKDDFGFVVAGMEPCSSAAQR